MISPAVQQSQPQQMQTHFQSASLYVGDLQTDATEGFLHELFSRVGPVASIRICRDSVTRRSLGYAYVNFQSMHDAERALDTLNFTDIKGKPCRIMWSQRDPTLRKSGVGNIFIKNLAPSVDHKSLNDLFSMCGNILSCKVVTDENGVSKGFAYVHFETAKAAEESIRALDNTVIEGKLVSVLPYSRKTERTSHNEWTNIYLKQFPTTWSDDDLTKVVSAFGPITSLLVQRDAETKASKGFGFVNFEKHEGAVAALEGLNGKVMEVDGTSYTLYASQAQKKTDRGKELKRQLEVAKKEKNLKLQGMNLFVKNIEESVSDDQLREMFSPFGTITSARIMRNDGDNVSRGFGFVCYTSAEEATKAITEMNNKLVVDKPITVCLHLPKAIRFAQMNASFIARGGMPARGNFPGAQGPFMGMFNQDGNRNFNRNFNNQGGRGMIPPGAAGKQFPPMGAFPPHMRQQGGMQFPPMMNGRGAGRGANNRGRGAMGMPMGMPMQGMRGNVTFNNQARNQPQMMPMNGMPMNMMPMEHMMPMNGHGINEVDLAAAEPAAQKHMIGERLYPMIFQVNPENAGKITGMLLEMESSELLHLLDTREALLSKITEAQEVLDNHLRENAPQ